MNSSPPIILFDGVCNLCAWAVRFIIERDPRGVFRFASLQSPVGQELMQKHGLNPSQLDSFVLVENDCAYSESTAALRVARHLGGAWPLFYGAIVLPRFVRDPIYKLIARNRYRWFGKKDTCMIPTPELRARFLDQG
ncbi:putative DCC family thiol-disulfide oxidoreductase YuxK [Roseimicrobium gellanilyticum]|uniref:Putative DCC family thiol-disulfide oxidoreductase YuxK n=1 Tax=Roseimicrobium gellanilyticum TaxID=748857 RepID=A0A366HQT7_9BACT|nr:thiol-disulfide oxidoreductase DCC family protein [Roseimicrobium gellanilyticum]RBP45454.1 putative DCC family thiol-disulfide oxidoreductase YuxK [Roseimicrobium gellanilyticum]